MAQAALAGALLLALPGCGPSKDPTDALGKAALLDDATQALTRQNCSEAIAILKPIYASKQTDNRVRMLMASAYGCGARVNLFNMAGKLIENMSSFTGSGFWEFLAREFPSTSDDRYAESGQLAQDAVHTIIDPAAVILPVNLYNADTFNPGTLSYVDRKPDANAFLFYISLATIGSLEVRYGTPFPNGKRGGPLPWTSASGNNALGSATQADGCAYASAVVNLVDSLGGLSAATTGSISKVFGTLNTAFGLAVFSACSLACTSAAISCPKCPASLRNRMSCNGTNDASIAAAGISTFMTTTLPGIPDVGWGMGP